ncbi:DUF4113 domain-containing protein [Pseudomonas sp. MGal98]|uniref:DUF4113 domain-containing protein n=1 Tax=Pseudomonas sp. MGal98 TaxID=3162460 RepID=UPI0032ED0D34
MDLSRRGEMTADPFAPGARFGSDPVLAAFDAINRREGAGTVGLGRVPAEPWWGMKREMNSWCYTTRWGQGCWGERLIDTNCIRLCRNRT